MLIRARRDPATSPMRSFDSRVVGALECRAALLAAVHR
jgi:hypothetical protein